MLVIISVVVLLFLVYLSLRHSNRRKLAQEARERMFALKHGIDDVKKHIASICVPATEEVYPDPDNLGCTAGVRAAVCAQARELAGQAEDAYTELSLLDFNTIDSDRLEARIREIDAAAIKVTRARRALLAKHE